MLEGSLDLEPRISSRISYKIGNAIFEYTKTLQSSRKIKVFKRVSSGEVTWLWKYLAGSKKTLVLHCVIYACKPYINSALCPSDFWRKRNWIVCRNK